MFTGFTFSGRESGAARLRRALFVVLTLLLALAAAAPAGADPEPAPRGPITAGQAVPAAPGALRSRAVSIDTAALPRSGATTVEFELFPGVAHTVHLEVVESHSTATAWNGTIEGVSGVAVVLVEQNGVINGTITAPEGTFVIGWDPSGTHVLSEVDEDARPEPGEPVTPPQTGADQPTAPSAFADEYPTTAEGGAIIDVLFVYTTASHAEVGGTAAAQSFAAARIAEMNAAFGNSDITARVRLAGIDTVAYAESGNLGTDLGRLANKSDGHMDGVHAARDGVGADLVQLLTSTGNYGGIAYVPNPEATAPISSFAEWAFSVATVGAAAGGYTSSHEMGHNLGAVHDYDHAPGPGYYTYSYGHRVSGEFATIMSYTTGCSCRRIPHFSNPAVAHEGVATGVSPGEPGEADNAGGFDSVAAAVASFRPEVLTPPPPSCDPPAKGGVVREAGADRYATAAAVSAADFPCGADRVFVATGHNFPDALSGAAVAGALGAPMLLVKEHSIPAATAAELARLDPDTIVVLGSAAVISSTVAAQLESYGAVIRLGGTDRYATSVEISEYGFPSGAAVAVVVTGESFADALAAGPAAARFEGPVLLTRRSELPGAVGAELARLDPDTIYVVGGSGVVSKSVADALRAYGAVTRLAGPDRYGTAAKMTQAAFPAGSERVYVAVGINFPDALAGGSAAGYADAPVLLTNPTSLPAATADEIERLGPTRIVILGGIGVVSSAIEQQLQALVG